MSDADDFIIPPASGAMPPRKARRRNETRDLVTPIRAALNAIDGVRVWRNSTGSLPGADGTPRRFGLGVGSADLVGLCDGRFFALEVKQPGRNATLVQRQWLAAVQKLGGFACVVRSIDEAHAAVVRSTMGLTS